MEGGWLKELLDVYGPLGLLAGMGWGLVWFLLRFILRDMKARDSEQAKRELDLVRSRDRNTAAIVKMAEIVKAMHDQWKSDRNR